MTIQPAEVLTSIRQKLDKIQREQGLSELDMRRALREAYAIAADIPERDAAEAYVMSRWHRFSEAERLTDRLLVKWGRSHSVLVYATNAYAYASCYLKALSTIREAGLLEPGNVSTYRSIEQLSMLAASPFSAYAAKQHLLKIGVSESEVDFGETEDEVAFMKVHNISDEQLSAYYQAHVNVVKEHLKGRCDCFFATRTQVMDVDDEDLLCLDIGINVDGVTAARIQWDMAGRDFSDFSAELRERVDVGVKPMSQEPARES